MILWKMEMQKVYVKYTGTTKRKLEWCFSLWNMTLRPMSTLTIIGHFPPTFMAEIL
jgi:hypothetical protein